MNTYQVQPEQQDGTLPLDRWESFPGETEQDALVTALRAWSDEGRTLPSAAYVAFQKPRHDNGAPMACRRFVLTYND